MERVQAIHELTQGQTVTIDAIGTQSEIAQQVVVQNGTTVLCGRISFFTPISWFQKQNNRFQ